MEEYRGFDQNGQLWIRAFYSHGVREGECKVWRSNGRLEEQKFYKKGAPEGKWKHWYSSGLPLTLEHYRNGVREGECKVWLQDGRLFVHEFYRNGLLIDSKLCITKPILNRIKTLKSLKFGTLSNFLIKDLNSS